MSTSPTAEPTGAAVIRPIRVTENSADLRELWAEYLAWVNAELDTHYGFTFPVDEILEANLADLSPFQPPGGLLLLATFDGHPVGVGCLQRLAPDTGEIKRMYVRPRARGTGTGRRLLVALLDAAHEAGYKHVRLDSVRFMHAAHALYRSAGFVETGPYPESEIPPEFWKYWRFMELALR